MITRLLAFAAFAALLAGPAAGSAPPTPLAAELQRALDELDRTRAEIAREKLPLAEKVAALESALIEERRRYEETRRKADNRSLELNQVRNDIKAREQEVQYLASLFSEYLRNLESRLHIAELGRHQDAISAARAAVERDDLPPNERLQGGAVAVKNSLRRLDELIGGFRYEGRAVGEDGRLHHGRFALIGPVAVFAASAEPLAGIVEQRIGSLEPSVAPFADPLLTEHARRLVEEGVGFLPFDGSLGNARKIETTRETLWEHIQKGGAVIYPILTMAALILGFSILKWLRLAAIRIPDARRSRALLAAVQNETDEAVEKHLAALRGPAARVLRAGWSRRSAPKEVVEEAMFAEVLEARFSFQRGLPFIAVGAACAPLLGLLGTVTGIIATFKLITVFGSGDVKMLSAGISEALITTEFGLIVAIPSLLLHAFLSRKARAASEQLEQLAMRFLGALGERRPPPPPEPAKDETQSSEAVPSPAAEALPA
jgi:biopolymer transport protein ExbB